MERTVLLRREDVAELGPRPHALDPVAGRVSITFGGHEYQVNAEMAAIFLRHALETISTGADELVPLHHRDGIELLFVTASSPLYVGSSGSTTNPEEAQ